MFKQKFSIEFLTEKKQIDCLFIVWVLKIFLIDLNFKTKF